MKHPKYDILQNIEETNYGPDIELYHFDMTKRRTAQNIQITRIQLYTLNHSFATRLFEVGIGMKYMQSLLKHNNNRTKEIWTHVATNIIEDIKSPLDTLN